MTERIAIQKFGTDTPTRARIITALSTQVSRQTAAITPKAMPKGRVMANASRASDRVTGSRSFTASATAWLSISERPKSPCARLTIQCQSCTGTGRSSPRSRRIWSIDA